MTPSDYTPSPRPTFPGPAHIPYAAATRHLWGDQVSGEVADWIYVSSDKIHHLVFGLPPGGAFRHSDAYRTAFAADDNAREDLYSLFVAFHNPRVHADAVADLEAIRVGFLLFLLNSVDDAIHKYLLLRP